MRFRREFVSSLYAQGGGVPRTTPHPVAITPSLETLAPVESKIKTNVEPVLDEETESKDDGEQF
jgi:hypothetical protein